MNDRPLFYVLDGTTPRPASVEEVRPQWDSPQRQLFREYVGSQAILVSTVFLVIDHAIEGPPVLFETMVFSSGGVLDEECERYSTYEEAMAGHAAMVARVKAARQWRGGPQ